MDTYPIPARSLERFYKIDGHTLEKNYKEHLSGFDSWDQKVHASEWVLLPKNMGKRLSIDESMHQNDLFTFLSNKEGHGKQGTLIATVRGTKAEEVIKHLMKLPKEQREAVEEVTMDFSDSMYAIVKAVFPNATIVIDCFHIIKRLCDGLDEMRMRFKRKAVTLQNKEKQEFNRLKKLRKKSREYYRKKHPKKNKKEKRGRPRLRKNEKFKPSTLSNGDTLVELYTRSKHFLAKSGDNWSERQKERAEILFDLRPELKLAYSLVCQLRAIFRNKKITRDEAKVKLHEWYHAVSASKMKELISAKDCIKFKEEEVLNYFINRSTNAAAESLNSKMKGFRSELRGVRDLAFYLYRCCMIFG